MVEDAKPAAAVDRRDFLAMVGAASAGAILTGPAAAAPEAGGAKAGATARLASARVMADDGLTWLPAWRLREMIGRREVSPVEVTDHFLARIEALDPTLHAFRMVDPVAAREQARHAERAVMAGDMLGPLHGVPTAFKEHIQVKGLTWHNLTTYEKTIATRDSIEAERIRAAGAIILGSLRAQSGPIDPATEPRNPWNPEHVPGGSSTGGGTAAAAALVPFNIGADGRGSTRLPAALCGVVGLRSTRGRVASVHPGVMNPRLMTESGPLTRDVRDAALVLQVLAGPDGRDPACIQSEPENYSTRLDAGVRGTRVGWTDDFGYAGKYARPMSDRVIAAARAAAFRIRDAGASIEQLGTVWEDPDFASRIVLGSDLALIVTNRRLMLNGADLPVEADVTAAQDSRRRIWQTFRSALSEHDFILSPTIAFTAPTLQGWTDGTRDPAFSPAYTAYTSAANLLGWPAITVPAGMVDGLPVGVQIMGGPNSEARMLRFAQALLKAQA